MRGCSVSLTTWLSYAPWSGSSRKEQLKSAHLHQRKEKTEPNKPRMEQYFKKRTKTTERIVFAYKDRHTLQRGSFTKHFHRWDPLNSQKL